MKNEYFMLSEINLLRATIFISALGYAFLWVFPYFFMNFYGREYYDIYLQHGFGAKQIFPIPIVYAIAIWYILSKILLMFFIKYTRELFFVLMAVNVIIASLSGMSVATPIESTIGYLVVLFDGIILSWVYFSPDVKRCFAKK
jgi:hypothetical protein